MSEPKFSMKDSTELLIGCATIFPASGELFLGDVLCCNGKIAQIASEIGETGIDNVIDATVLTLIPGVAEIGTLPQMNPPLQSPENNEFEEELVERRSQTDSSSFSTHALRVCQLRGTRPPGLPNDIRQMEEWELLRRQIYQRGMKFSNQLTFDFRELLSDGKNAKLAGVMMWKLIEPFKPQVLVGPGFGAMPLLFSTALAAAESGINLQVLMIRDKRKEHNKKRWVEGHRESAQGKRAVFIDDFMEGGSAFSLVNQALASDKVKVELVAVALLFDMWEPLGSRQLSVSRLPILALFTRHDVGLSRDCFDARPPLMKGTAPDFISEQPLWRRFALNQQTGYTTKCAPAIAYNHLFVADDRSQVWCHDLETGNVRWHRGSLSQPTKGIVQMLQYADNSIVYSCYDGTITRIQADTGQPLWRWKIDSSIHATPWIDQSQARLFINTEQWNEGKPRGHLQCLDWVTGRLKWKFDHAWWPPGSPCFEAILDLVFATCNDETLVAVNATTGTKQWQVTTKGLVRGRPLVKDGRLYVATEEGTLHCFDVASGESLWTQRYGKGLWHQFVYGARSLVFVMDGQWHLIAFDAKTGELRWLNRLRSPGCWTPIPYGRYLVVLSKEGHLAVFCPEQEVKVWEGRIPGNYNQPPAVSNGMLVAASSNKGLMAYKIAKYYEE
ncbi:MAG: PQQ-binding-like beta-propeller repeat protein [Microcystis panniformis]